jgi:hypothetical protein
MQKHSLDLLKIGLEEGLREGIMRISVGFSAPVRILVWSCRTCEDFSKDAILGLEV